MNIKQIIDKWMPKIQAVFSAIPWKNLLAFLFFLVVAFIFWLMLFFRQNVESTYKIPLKYTNIPEDVVFDNPLPQYIEVRLSDKGSEIFLYDLVRRDSLEINVEENQTNKINVIQGNQFYQLINSRLSPSTKILGYYPPSISLATSKLEKKELLVKFDGEIATSRANLVADSATFIPERVIAYGSAKALAKLEKALTEYTVFNNLKATSQLKIKLKTIDGIKFVPSEAEIYIPVKEFTERTFEVSITCQNLPPGMDAKFFPSRVNVAFSTTLEEYKKIAPEDFEIKLDYNKFKSNENGRVDLELTATPPAVRNVRISPSSVEFLFENR